MELNEQQKAIWDFDVELMDIYNKIEQLKSRAYTIGLSLDTADDISRMLHYAVQTNVMNVSNRLMHGTIKSGETVKDYIGF